MSSQPVHISNNNENNNTSESVMVFDQSERVDPSLTTIAYPVRSGTITLFEVSPKACEPFGFYCGERVQVRGGKVAWVIGVRENNLFFHIDGDKGASYYCNHTYEHFLKDGFKLMSPRFVNAGHLKSSDANNNNNNNLKTNIHIAPSFKTLVGDKNFADVTFQVGSELIPAHKNILVTRSEYFRAMFLNGMKENQQDVIQLPNMDAQTFTSVLEFLYTGNVTVDEKSIVSLVNAAAIFRIDDLKELCISQFNAVVSEENVINLLLMAEAHQEDYLKKTCKRYILDNYQEMLRTESFKQLISSENSELLIEIMSLLSPQSVPQSNTNKKRKVHGESKGSSHHEHQHTHHQHHQHHQKK